jgi:HNH endonuclease
MKKQCIKCGKDIFKKVNESSKYWKTKRFCSYHCSSLNRPGFWKNKKLPYDIWNKNKKIPFIIWNKGLTIENSKKVREMNIKSANSRRNKPRKEFRIIGGYKMIFKPEHPRSCKVSKCVSEQILIMEQYLHRYLNPQEVVHHINENKLDNRFENLILFPNKSEHMRWHAFNSMNSGLRKIHLKSGRSAE